MTDDKRDTIESADAGQANVDAPSAGRRDAITKLAYASPPVAGLLFSKRAAAFSPPPAPSTSNP